MAEIGFDDFLKLDVRVGTIRRVEPYPEARTPAYKIHVDFGPEIGERKTSAQVTTHYEMEALVGRQVAAVVNFPPKQIGKFMSEILILGFPDAAGERRDSTRRFQANRENQNRDVGHLLPSSSQRPSRSDLIQRARFTMFRFDDIDRRPTASRRVRCESV